jgi:hypothetical protein
MNNQLTQKYHYYLNESNRLSEELKLQKEYTEVLQNVLIELFELEQLDESLVSSAKNKLKGVLAAMGIGIPSLIGGTVGAAGASQIPNAIGGPAIVSTQDRIAATGLTGMGGLSGIAAGSMYTHSKRDEEERKKKEQQGK